MESKTNIIKGYLDQFPNAKTKTLSNLIYEENKELWASAESVRSLVRRIRGNNGDKCRKHADPKHKKPNGKSGDPFKLPHSEEPDWADVLIPPGNNRILLLSDIHLPYHSIEAVTKAIEYGNKKDGVNTVILNGDILDFYQASSFARDPRKKDLAYEFEVFKEFISKLYFALGEPKIYFKCGNHEERFERYLFVKAPELIGIDEFKLDILLEFGKYGIEYVDKKRIIKAGDLAILHGHEFGRSIFSPVNPARGAFLRAKDSVIVGHNHQSSEHTEPTVNGRIITTWSTGCLCGLNPEYMPINKWNHGFAYIETSGEEYKVSNKRIYKGEIL